MGTDMKETKASVIIPCYNNQQFVRDTIESVLNQTYEPTEIIVIDDGSTDGSLDVIRSFSDRITWRTGENQGACHARNWGAELASGDCLMFLDADDLISPDTIAALVNALDGGKKKLAACPWSTLKRGEEGWKKEATGLSRTSPRGDPVYGWLSGWYVPLCALMWSRPAYELTGGWDEQLHANQDGDLVLRALTSGASLTHTSEGMGFYRDHGTARASTSVTWTEQTVRSRARVLCKITKRLKAQGQLEKYAVLIGKKYYSLARHAATIDAALFEKYRRLSRKYAGNQASSGTFMHRALSSVLGLRRKEQLAATLANFGIGSSKRLNSNQIAAHHA